mmetsp:Transcript_57565/g.137233  ORF Transcript_57565/g.137233 Transcript_57565/m.137233 type:complete len:245 (-) Transcript_57565:481-1215(-)
MRLSYSSSETRRRSTSSASGRATAPPFWARGGGERATCHDTGPSGAVWARAASGESTRERRLIRRGDLSMEERILRCNLSSRARRHHRAILLDAPQEAAARTMPSWQSRAVFMPWSALVLHRVRGDEGRRAELVSRFLKLVPLDASLLAVWKSVSTKCRRRGAGSRQPRPGSSAPPESRAINMSWNPRPSPSPSPRSAPSKTPQNSTSVSRGGIGDHFISVTDAPGTIICIPAANVAVASSVRR